MTHNASTTASWGAHRAATLRLAVFVDDTLPESLVPLLQRASSVTYLPIATPHSAVPHDAEVIICLDSGSLERGAGLARQLLQASHGASRVGVLVDTSLFDCGKDELRHQLRGLSAITIEGHASALIAYLGSTPGAEDAADIVWSCVRLNRWVAEMQRAAVVAAETTSVGADTARRSRPAAPTAAPQRSAPSVRGATPQEQSQAQPASQGPRFRKRITPKTACIAGVVLVALLCILALLLGANPEFVALSAILLLGFAGNLMLALDNRKNILTVGKRLGTLHRDAQQANSAVLTAVNSVGQAASAGSTPLKIDGLPQVAATLNAVQADNRALRAHLSILLETLYSDRDNGDASSSRPTRRTRVRARGNIT